MPETTPEPLTPEQAAEVDAQYRPFPSFDDWAREVPHQDLWDQDLAVLRETAAGAGEDELKQAQEIAMRAAAFDSGAIEGLYPTDRGLTLTVATQAAAWEQKVDERSKDARSLFESQLTAFELVLDLVTEQVPRLTQTWIRRLHEEITSAQDTYWVHTSMGKQEQPLPRGKYKEHPNHVVTRSGETHAYAPVDLTQAEMQRFLDELAGSRFASAHPALQASYAHYAFVAVHPFADGNGRVARALASVFTYRAATVPMLVLAHQRDAYFEALSVADGGEPTPFIDFTASTVREAIAMVTETLKTAQAPQPEAVLDAFREMFVAQGDLSHQQLDQIANEFIDAVGEIAAEQVGALTLPDGIAVKVVMGSGVNRSGPPDGFRQVVSPSPRYMQVEFASPPPAAAAHVVHVDLFVATGRESPATLVLQDAERLHEKIALGLGDLQPQLSAAGRHRTSNYVRRLLGAGLDTLYRKASSSLEREGYR